MEKIKRCKHQSGEFQETIEAYHYRKVFNGVMQPDSFNNDYGSGIRHSYLCDDCEKYWEWKLHPKPQWLKILFENAYTDNHK